MPDDVRVNCPEQAIHEPKLFAEMHPDDELDRTQELSGRRLFPGKHARHLPPTATKLAQRGMIGTHALEELKKNLFTQVMQLPTGSAVWQFGMVVRMV